MRRETIGERIERFRKWREETQDTRFWWRAVFLLPLLLIRMYFTEFSSAVFATILLAAGAIVVFLIRRSD
jgi:hypothetical protein